MHFAALVCIGAAARAATTARLEEENKLLETENRQRRALAATQRQRLAFLADELGVVHGATGDSAGPQDPETQDTDVSSFASGDAQSFADASAKVGRHDASAVEKRSPVLEGQLRAMSESSERLATEAITLAQQADPERVKTRSASKEALKASKQAGVTSESADAAFQKIDELNRALYHQFTEAMAVYKRLKTECKDVQDSWFSYSGDICASADEAQAAYMLEKKLFDYSKKAKKEGEKTQSQAKTTSLTAQEVVEKARDAHSQTQEQDDRELETMANQLLGLSKLANGVLQSLEGRSSASGGPPASRTVPQHPYPAHYQHPYQQAPFPPGLDGNPWTPH